MANVDKEMNVVNKKKITFCIDSPGWGGSEINAIKLVEQLSSKYEIEMVVNPNAANELKNFISNKKIPSITYHFPAAINYIFSGIASARRRIIRNKENIYIVWLHHLNSNRWMQLALAIFRRKFIIVEQLLPTSYEVERTASRLSLPLKDFIGRRASAVVICAYSQKDTYIKHIKANNPVVIPNSRNVRRINSIVADLRVTTIRNNKSVKICCVGRLTAQKDQETLIKAVALLNGFFAVEVIFVGDGEDKDKLVALAKRFNVRIHITGFVHDVFPYLADSDIFVLPSTDEGLPGALIEAMAASVPCIVSDIPGNNELVMANETGLIFPVGDHRILSDKIKYIVQNPLESEKFSKNGFNHVLKNYDESVEYSLWFRLLESECLN